jgi:APA family basic amino acid/polyamine antiporter
MDPHPTSLRRVLGRVDAVCVVVGAVIGAGIFFTPGSVARVAGSEGLALAAWVAGGAIALLGALTFARLGALYTGTGAQYEILRDAWGAPCGFLFVFCNATAIQAGAVAIIAVICAQHLGIAIGAVPGPGMLLALAAILIAGLATANAAGVAWGAAIQNVTAFAKVATLLAVTALAALHGGAAPAEPAADPGAPGPASALAALCAALVPAFFAYGGWQQALWIAGEVRHPARDVPRAILAGMAIVVTAYVLVNWAYLRLLGQPGLAASGAVAADVMAAAWPAGGRLAAAAVALSCFGVLNAQLLAGPRLVYAMARDGRFFAPFAAASPGRGTPVPAIGLIAGMGLLLLAVAAWRSFGGMIGWIDSMLAWVVVVDGVFFALTAAALPVLRRRFMLVPALFVAGEIALITGALLNPGTRASVAVGGLWIAAGAALYAILFRASRPQRQG